nr:MAG TPA: DNA directed DNA polymerase [Bacteriophage sp.]
MQFDNFESLILEATKPHNKDKAQSYLSSRKLNLFDNVGYITYAEIYNFKIINSLIIPVTSPEGEVIMLDTKSLQTNDYLKVTKPETHQTPLYNLTKIVKHRIITEGILNAQSLIQNLEGFTVSSTLRASMNAKTYHILASSVNETLITAFDNDAAGVTATSELINFFKEFYPNIKISILDFPYNDLNEFLIKANKEAFKLHIMKQINKFQIKD